LAVKEINGIHLPSHENLGIYMKNLRVALLYALLLLSTVSFAQVEANSDLLRQAKTAIRSSDAKALSNFFNKTVSINFDGETSIYSKTQSEFVLKDFFKKYPVIGFEYDHVGKSPEGLQYAIGKYAYNGGAFLVYIMIKESNGVQIIDTVNFHEEDD
jgi:hypothetical protein